MLIGGRITRGSSFMITAASQGRESEVVNRDHSNSKLDLQKKTKCTTAA